MAKENQKFLQYAGQITIAISEMLSGDHADNNISQEELMEDDNLTHFMHALANVVPTLIYCDITGENTNQLEFNHIANKLCFQFGRSALSGSRNMVPTFVACSILE